MTTTLVKSAHCLLSVEAVSEADPGSARWKSSLSDQDEGTRLRADCTQ